MTSLTQTQKLLWVMDKLRDPNGGCPWDLAQRFETIVPYTIEEAYEVADAIEHGDLADVRDELGDLLFQVVFYAKLGQEQGAFDFESVAAGMVEKLIRRHPHVFDTDYNSMDQAQVSANWEAIKQQERREKGQDADNSTLANIPAGMAPLLRAHKLQKKAAKVGFDWTEIGPVVAKIHEEIDEVMDEVNAANVNPDAVEDEIGDLLFAVVNLARHAKVDAEKALRRANRKFESRFRGMEALLKGQNKHASDCSLDELETLWQQVKGQ